MNARDYAFDLIATAGLPSWPPGKKQRPPRPPADGRDRGLGEAIAKTAIKNLLLLRHAIAHYTQRPLRDIDTPVQIILAIAVAQLRFFDRVPPSAAVDEAVEQTKRFKLGRAAGFVNAALRRATREPSLPLPPRDSAAAYAETVLSHPREIFHRYAEWLGEADALRLCEKNNTEAPTIARLASGVTIDQLLAAVPADRPLSIHPHEVAGMIVIEQATEPDYAAWAASGLAQVQDPTSAAIVDQLNLAPGQRVLDRCCGVGTKTLQIAGRVGASGFVLATDPAKHRIKRLEQTLQSCGMGHVQASAIGMLPPIDPQSPGDSNLFDRILIDAPCSNSGVLQRRPEARYRQTPADLKSLEGLQRRIIGDTVGHVRPGGLLVYSTCSIWPEENERMAEWIVAGWPDFEQLSQQTTLAAIDPDPARHHDGGFVAVFRKVR
jgi:16S rRNA (cytosine967-C5)-methyltransferase